MTSVANDRMLYSIFLNHSVHPVSVSETATSVQSKAVKTYMTMLPLSKAVRRWLDKATAVTSANTKRRRTVGTTHFTHSLLSFFSPTNSSSKTVLLAMIHLNSEPKRFLRAVSASCVSSTRFRCIFTGDLNNLADTTHRKSGGQKKWARCIRSRLSKRPLIC